jgi:type IV pilus assembly protein PilY1
MRPRIHTWVCACLAAIIVGTAGLAYGACDPPLVVSNAGGRAKVLFILDNSGSMNEAVTSVAYDAGVAYTGSFNANSTYNVSADGNYTPQSLKNGLPSTPSAFLVTSDQGQSGQYPGNYLNWIYFHASAAEVAAIPAMTRIQTAKQALNTVLATGSGCDYGVMIFNRDNGGTLLSPIGTAPATIQAQVNTVRADAYTPLAETMVTALDYFKTTGTGAPMQASCEKLFVIMVTDGFPTMDLNVPAYLQDYDQDGRDPGTCASLGAPYPNSMDCSGYLDDVAYYLFKNDLRPDLSGMQNAVTYVIGFDLYAPILQSTATEGGGAYYSARNAATLSSALDAAFNLIAAQMSASASVSVVSAEDRTHNQLFRARFESQTWRGYVESFQLPYHTGASPQWEAGALLQGRSPDSRILFTSTSGTNKVDLVAGSAASLVTPLAAADITEATQIIAYTRGTASTGTRDRGGWKLGDVVDAAPLMVGKPTGFNPLIGYSAFRAANAGRAEALYVGANDGMLHCFDAANGNEQWAYVPRNQLPRLRDLMSPSYCHEFSVNLTPSAFDLYTNGAWKTVLVGGEERGGSGLFALDVTDPAASNISVLWDVDLPQLKGSWNPPTLVRDRTLNAQVFCVGTGYDAAVSQASLLVLDPASGSMLSSYLLGTAVAGNKTTKATAIDMDFDGYQNRLYLADLAGRVWRVNLDTNPWTVSLFFDCGQPIQAAPVLTRDELGRVMLFFGTGQYLTSSDLATTGNQTIYGLVDDNSGTTISALSLVNQTTSIHPVTSGSRGWYIDLVQAPGERITRRAALVAGALYVPSFRPNSGSCQSGGDSWLYSLDFKDGSAPNNANGTQNNTITGRVESEGAGILSDPSVDLMNETLIIQSSNASLLTHGFIAGLKRLVVRSWRQKWN